MMKPLFDKENPPPSPKVKPATTAFVTTTFENVAPNPRRVAPSPKQPGAFSPKTFGDMKQQPTQPSQHSAQTAPMLDYAATCKQFDSSLTAIEVTRIQRLVAEINASAKREYADDLIKLITSQTDQIFQYIVGRDSNKGTAAVTEFAAMAGKFSAYKKTSAFTSFFKPSKDKIQFESLLKLLRQSIDGIKPIESKLSADIEYLTKTQQMIGNTTTTCRNYLRYINQYVVAGKIFQKESPDERVERTVEKLEGVYAVSLNTAVAQLTLIEKTNSLLLERVQGIMDIKIPQWKQNAATILIVAEQKKLQGIDSEIEANFDALLKLI